MPGAWHVLPHFLPTSWGRCENNFPCLKVRAMTSCFSSLSQHVLIRGQTLSDVGVHMGEQGAHRPSRAFDEEEGMSQPRLSSGRGKKGASASCVRMTILAVTLGRHCRWGGTGPGTCEEACRRSRRPEIG